jgi:hypothetical protein
MAERIPDVWPPIEDYNDEPIAVALFLTSPRSEGRDYALRHFIESGAPDLIQTRILTALLDGHISNPEDAVAYFQADSAATAFICGLPDNPYA